MVFVPFSYLPLSLATPSCNKTAFHPARSPQSGRALREGLAGQGTELLPGDRAVTTPRLCSQEPLVFGCQERWAKSGVSPTMCSVSPARAWCGWRTLILVETFPNGNWPFETFTNKMPWHTSLKGSNPRLWSVYSVSFLILQHHYVGSKGGRRGRCPFTTVPRGLEQGCNSPTE